MDCALRLKIIREVPSRTLVDSFRHHLAKEWGRIGRRGPR
jgi:hypothetical protein